MPTLIDHLGAWTGSWSTFFEPDDLFDASPLQANIEQNDDGFVIAYTGSIKGEDVEGRLVWSEDDTGTTVDWVDSWHTGGKHERLEGLGDAAPSYQYGGDEPWTWEISIDATDSGVTVIHHNSGPAIPRYVGVLMKLESRSS